MTDEIVPAVVMRNISKNFGGVRALDGVDFEARAGEVHALVGENGAGKSTLIKVLSGAHARDSGEILVRSNLFLAESVQTSPKGPAQLVDLHLARANARKSGSFHNGISVIYQEFALAPDLTVAENIYVDCLGDKIGLIHWKELQHKAKELLAKLGFSDIDVMKPVSTLSVAYQQVVEICKALTRESKILVLDEPTAVLTKREIDRLFEIIADLKARGVCIIYVSHRLEEIFKICDRVTVLKDGKTVGMVNIDDVDQDKLVKMMIGREMKDYFPERKVDIGEVVLQVNHLSSGNAVKDVSLYVRKGEILGLSGLVGAGRTETFRAIFGADRRDSGEILINGKPEKVESPRDAVARGVGMLPEDRKRHGVLLKLSVKINGTLTILNRLRSLLGMISRTKEDQTISDLIAKLHVQVRSPEDPAETLSGGNQQKVSLMKWIASNSKVLLLDEPTRGVDVGSKVEIYKFINALAAQGVGIIIASSEMPEIIGMSDRVIVMHNGMVAGELGKDMLTEYNLIKLAMGVSK